MAKILKLEPYVVEKIWGGHKLKEMKNLTSLHKSGSENIGETWEVSLLDEGPSLDKVSGKKIADILGRDSFQYLVKFIDTSDDLSVQVHPDDEYAKKHESSLGKTECWYILSADSGAGIYLGLKEGIKKEDIQKAINNRENLSSILNFIPVKSGDFFYVPAGTIHAIGKGITLAEVQQSSGITYRVWDWNRVDGQGQSRELHIEKALDVINFDPAKNELHYFKPDHNQKSRGIKNLIEYRDFNLDLYEFTEPFEVQMSLDQDQRPISILNLRHTLVINGEKLNPYQTLMADGEQVLNITSCPEEDLSEPISFLYIY